MEINTGGSWKSVADNLKYALGVCFKERNAALRWSAAWKEKATELYRLIKILGRSGCEIKKIDGDHYNVRYPVVYLPEKGLDEAQQVARRLLRERDDVRAERNALAAKIFLLIKKQLELQEQVSKVEAERDEARAKIDGMRKEIDLVLADWDEATAKIKTLQSQVQLSEKMNQNLITHHRIERDRAAFETEALQSQVNHLESDRDALAKQVDELRGALEQVEFVSFADKTWCPWCLNLNHIHNNDCIRQKALGKA